MAAAKKSWKSKCASCHSADGTGSAKGKALGVGDLSSAAWQSEHGDEAITATLTAPKKLKSGKKLVAHFTKLKAADARAMLAYLRSLAAGK